MRLPKQVGTIVSTTVALLMSTAAHAGARPFMPLGDAVAPPPGYADLCARGESACETPEAIVAGVAPASPILATASIGATQAAFGATEPGLYAPLQFSVLEAYRPAIDATLTPAGVLDGRAAPVAALPAPAAVVAQPASVQAGQMRLVNTINRAVNKDVHKRTDFDLYGLLEYWSLPRVIDGKMYGDCEDYALEKRRRLIEAGVPAEALSMAVAVTARGESHAVLVVRFESGDWVLDNLTPWATPWEELNYRWIQRQAGSGAWKTIG